MSSIFNATDSNPLSSTLSIQQIKELAHEMRRKFKYLPTVMLMSGSVWDRLVKEYDSREETIRTSPFVDLFSGLPVEVFRGKNSVVDIFARRDALKELGERPVMVTEIGTLEW